ncbi:MAG: lasso RiPP family leader peptide-containing protein [Hyphomicrobiales bacterium]
MKKIYSSPRLTEHGDIRTVTQGEWDLSLAEGVFQKKPDPTS